MLFNLLVLVCPESLAVVLTDLLVQSFVELRDLIAVCEREVLVFVH